MLIQSAGYALSWEYWRRGMFWIVPACAGLIVGCTGLLFSVIFAKVGMHNAAALDQLNNAISAFVCWTPLVLALASRASLRRLYTLPLRTRAIVGWTLANGAAAVIITFWLAAFAFNILLGTDWPLLEPAWWSVVVYVGFQALIWSFTRLPRILLVPISLLGITVVANAHPVLARLTGSAETSPLVSVAILAGSLGAVAICSLAAVVSVSRDRRNAGWLPRRPGVAQRPVPHAAKPTSGAAAWPRFRSPQAAQVWLEWRWKGRWVVTALIGIVGCVWCFLLMGPSAPRLVSSTTGSFTGMLMMVSPFIGLFLGSYSGRFDMTSFTATRPQTDRSLAAAVLGNVAIVIGLCTAIWLTNLLAIHAAWQTSEWAMLSGAFRQFDLDRLHELYQFTLSFALFAWTLVGLGASLALARSWFIPVVGVVLALLPLTLMLILSWGGYAWILLAFFALALLSGTVAAFAAARAQRLVSNRSMFACLAGWLLIAATFHLPPTAPTASPPDAMVRFILLAFCTLPFAPLAVAPLALSWNRHR